MDWKTRALRACGWSLGLALILWLIGVALTRVAIAVDPNEAKVDEVTNLEDRNYDVLFLGNSVTYQGINPETIDAACGTTSYNLALGGSHAIEQNLLLEQYLAHNKPPRLVVFGVTPNLGDVGEDLRPSVYLRLSHDQLKEYDDYRTSTGQGPLGWADAMLHRFPAYRHRRAIEPLLKLLLRGDTRKPTYVQGHLTLNEVAKVPDRWPAREAGIDAEGIERLLDTCEQARIPVLVLELPNSPSFNASVLNRDKVLDQLKKIVAAHANAKFLSLNEADGPRFDAQYWFGVNHLNSAGAKKFSEILAPYIAAELAETSSPSPPRS
jgi:hypothetical protein